jgi:hypothetical protein
VILRTVKNGGKEMRLIDILNMISIGELEKGTKIKYKLSIDSYIMLIFDGNSLKCEKNNKNFSFDYADTQAECELIEEKIKELDVDSFYDDIKGYETLDCESAVLGITDKLNEVIRRINNVR